MRVQFRLDSKLTRVIPILIQMSNMISIVHSDSYREVFPFFYANNNKIKQETVFNNLTYNNAISFLHKSVADCVFWQTNGML